MIKSSWGRAMKKSRFLFGAVIPLLSGCSCSLFDFSPFSWEKYKNDSFSMSLSSEKFEKYNLESFPNFDSKLSALKDVVTSKGNRNTFINKYNEVSANLLEIVNCYIISSTKYYATNSPAYEQKTNEYYSLYSNASRFLMDLEVDIYNSSDEIKKAYFGDMSNSEIEKRINGNADSALKAQYDETFKEYQNDGQQLYLAYRNGGMSKENYLLAGFDYFYRYVEKANELIGKISDNNYLDFAYDYYYSRDYKYTDAIPFVNYVKQYFVPIAKNKSKLKVPSDVNKTLLSVIGSYNMCNRKASMCDVFEAYAQEMGGDYLNAYNNAFKNGYYCFSDNSNSMGTAYEWNLQGINDAVLFFSSNYQDVLSVTHEFGHYYSCVQNGGVRKNDAYDLQETYSQGNEFTFCKYLLEQKSGDSDAATYNYFVDDKIFNSISQIINEAAITEIEQFAYTTKNLTRDSLEEGVNNILNSYEGTASDTYFMAPCLSSPCYYVSYAISLMEALQFASFSFGDAKTHYFNLIQNNDEMTMVQRWESAGLTSPFKEQTFITLAELFSSIAKKY